MTVIKNQSRPASSPLLLICTIQEDANGAIQVMNTDSTKKPSLREDNESLWTKFLSQFFEFRLTLIGTNELK